MERASDAESLCCLILRTALMWVGMQTVTMELKRHFSFDLTLWLLGIVFISPTPQDFYCFKNGFPFSYLAMLSFRVLLFVFRLPTIDLNAVKRSY